MRKLLIAAALLAGLWTAAAYADSEHYEPLVIAPSEVLTDAASGDTTVVGNKPIRSLALKKNPTVYARVDFSGTSGDTVVLYCHLWLKLGTDWHHLGVWQTTATAGAVTNGDGDNLSTNLAVFDTSGATHAEVRIATPSAGNVDLAVWAGAADGEN